MELKVISPGWIRNGMAVLVWIAVFNSTVPSVSKQISFEHAVIDKRAMGHRPLGDIDGDGDLDIMSPAWDNYRFLHVWRNDSDGGQRR